MCVNLVFFFPPSSLTVFAPDRKLMFACRDMKCTIFTAEDKDTHESGDDPTPSPPDPVASGMTNRPQVGESRDPVCGGEAAHLTGLPQTLTTRMSYLIDQQSMLAFGCLFACLCVCVGRGKRQCVFRRPPPMQNNLWWRAAINKHGWLDFGFEKKNYIWSRFRQISKICLLSFLQKHNAYFPFFFPFSCHAL